MAGLILLGIAGLWVFFAVKVAGWVGRRFGPSSMSSMAGLVAFVAVVLAPFTDEIVGTWQFNRLCTKEAIIWTHPQASIVEAARDAPGHGRRERDEFVIPVTEQVTEYVDVATGQPFIRMHAFHTPGGFVMRAGLNMGSSRSCWPEAAASETFKKLNLNELLKRGRT